jgi:hypothetical protein
MARLGRTGHGMAKLSMARAWQGRYGQVKGRQFRCR